MGLAAAQQLAAEGAKVIIAGRTQSKLEAAVKLIKDAGGEVHAVAADVGSDADNKRIVDTALELYGRLDISFVNAGTVGMAGFSEVTDEIIDTVFNTNVKSVAFAFKYQLPAIEKSGGKGSVVVNTSVMGITATTQDSFHGAGIYSASKSAANMLTQYAAVEAAKHGTRVNAIAPASGGLQTAAANTSVCAAGLVKTEIMGDALKTDADWDAMSAPIRLLDKTGTAEEVSKLVCFLLSDDASFITGSIYGIDGGALLKM
eukprot:14608-Heterococcus_DN1.PRE.1